MALTGEVKRGASEISGAPLVLRQKGWRRVYLDMTRPFCDLTLRTAPSVALDELLADIRGRWRESRKSSFTRTPTDAFITEAEARFIVAQGDAAALEEVMCNKTIQIKGWPRARLNLFWWQACQDAKAKGATWSFLIDRYAIVHGWPDKHQIKTLNDNARAAYDPARPREIFKGLESWAQTADKETVLAVLTKNYSMVASLMARQTTVLDQQVLFSLAKNPKLLRETLQKNPNITSQVAEALWPRLVETMTKERVLAGPPERGLADRPKNAAGSGNKAKAVDGRAETRESARLLVQKYKPTGQLIDVLWEWAIERSGDTRSTYFSPAPVAQGKSWAANLAREILLHPKCDLSRREVDALWAAAPTWEVANQIVFHPNLSQVCGERVCEVLKSIAWRQGKVYGVQERADAIISGLAGQAWFGQSALVREFVINKAEGKELGIVLRALDPQSHQEVVEHWMKRDPSMTINWLQRARESDKAYLSAKVLVSALASQYKDIRLLAAQVVPALTKKGAAEPQTQPKATGIGR